MISCPNEGVNSYMGGTKEPKFDLDRLGKKKGSSWEGGGSSV